MEFVRWGRTDGVELFCKKCPKVSKSAKKYQWHLDHFQSQQQMHQILQLKYELHREAPVKNQMLNTQQSNVKYFLYWIQYKKYLTFDCWVFNIWFFTGASRCNSYFSCNIWCICCWLWKWSKCHWYFLALFETFGHFLQKSSTPSVRPHLTNSKIVFLKSI